MDICYPAQNRRLYEELLEKGGLLSTYTPGTKPLPQYFPPRNRIVSGLSDALIVIEARQKSGTLITVDMALEQGRDVYVVPGRLTDRLSDGCNHLLTQGAGVFLSPESFAEDFLRSWEEKQGLSADIGDAVAGTLGEGRIYGHFRTEPGTDGTGTFGICQTEQSGTFQHFCELTRLSEKGYSNRHMRMTRKVRCPYER